MPRWVASLALSTCLFVAAGANAQTGEVEPSADPRISQARSLLDQARTADDQALLLDERADKLSQLVLRKKVDGRQVRDQAKESPQEQRPRLIAQAEGIEADAVVDELEAKRLRGRAEELRKGARAVRADALRAARGETVKAGEAKVGLPASRASEAATASVASGGECTPPFVVNREGIKIFRRECLTPALAFGRDPCDPPYDINPVDGRKKFRGACFDRPLADATKTCNPPYTQGEDGVRHVKPECLFDTRR